MSNAPEMITFLVKFSDNPVPELFQASNASAMYRLISADKAEWLQIVYADGTSAFGPMVKPDPETVTTKAEWITPLVMANIIDLIKNDRKIMAIKELRTATKWGLKESKDYVDALTVELRNFGVIPFQS